MLWSDSSGKLQLYDFLGSGCHGDVWDLGNGKALKVAGAEFSKMVWKERAFYQDLFEHLIETKYNFIVPLYDYHISKKFFGYTMAKLNPLPRKDRRVLDYWHTIGADDIDEVLNRAKHPQLLDLWSKIKRADLKPFDLHGNNVLQDEQGNWKIIDVEALL